MLSIALRKKILKKCLYMGYRPTVNSEPLVRPLGQGLRLIKTDDSDNLTKKMTVL